MRISGFVYGLCMTAACVFSAAIPASAKDCVRAVRSMSDFDIRGDAWAWWQNSQGVYDHDLRPKTGSVLVFKRTGHLGRGHVSLVSAVIDRRTIEVDHTWLRSSEIRHGMTVIDVSADNDWSQVRVWNEPTDQIGQRVYPTYGFVLPAGAEPTGILTASADRGKDDDHFSSTPSNRHGKQSKLVLAKASVSSILRGRTHNSHAAHGKNGHIMMASAKVVPHKPGAKPTHVAHHATTKPVKPHRQVAAK